MDWIGSMIRTSMIEEIGLLSNFLELLDDTLRSVRSFEVGIESTTSLDLLAQSFERTKAEGDKFERVSLCVSWGRRWATGSDESRSSRCHSG